MGKFQPISAKYREAPKEDQNLVAVLVMRSIVSWEKYHFNPSISFPPQEVVEDYRDRLTG